ncbi:hypothetical protein [Sorangium sp. So ce341]|uniref:hypothetical protein n=1 Tax=Sorangium sp. So ce341 TaxID=3133302 RepID=UPI003F6015B5
MSGHVKDTKTDGHSARVNVLITYEDGSSNDGSFTDSDGNNSSYEPIFFEVPYAEVSHTYVEERLAEGSEMYR